MSTIFIIPPTWSAGAVSAGGTAEPDAPVSNLLHQLPSHSWKTSNLVNMFFVLNALSVKRWNAVALMYTNASATCQWRIVATNTLSTIWTAPLYDTGLLPFRMSPNLESWTYWHSVIFFAPGSFQHQYIGIQIIDPDNIDGHFKAGVCVIGEYYSPVIGYDPRTSGWDKWIDLSVETRLRSGERTFRYEPRKKHGKFDFPNQSNPHAKAWDDFSRIYGNSYPVVVKTREIDGSTLWHQHTMCYGTMNITIQEITRIPPAYSNVTVEIEEI